MKVVKSPSQVVLLAWLGLVIGRAQQSRILSARVGSGFSALPLLLTGFTYRMAAEIQEVNLCVDNKAANPYWLISPAGLFNGKHNKKSVVIILIITFSTCQSKFSF